VRPHSALADHPPETFAARWAETATPGSELVPTQAGKPVTQNPKSEPAIS
jgi:NADPH-dependent ferric siderophore reductase